MRSGFIDKMRIELIKHTLILTVLLAAVSCDHTENHILTVDYGECPVPDSLSPIAMNVEMGPSTRAVDPLTTPNLTSFDVIAIWNYNGSAANKWYLRGQEVTKPSTVWTTTPPSYWTVTGNLSFFMYTPKASANIVPVYPVSGMPGIEYTPSTTDIANQQDLCLARPVLNATKEIGPVPATFHHTLTQIWFDMNYTGTPPSGYSVKVENIRLCNIIGTRTATYSTTTPYFEWSGGTPDTDYELKLSSSHLQNVYLPLKPAVEIPVQNSLGRLYLIPQTLDPSACIEITYSFFDTAPEPDVRKATFTKTVSIPSPSVWPANRTIRYKVTVDVGVSSPINLSGYSIDDWTESGSVHTDIEFD